MIYEIFFLFAGSDQADEDLTKGRGRGRDGQEGGEGGLILLFFYNPPRPKASGGLKDKSQFFVIWK